MADELKDLEDKTEQLEKDIEEIAVSIDKELSSRCEEIKKEIDGLKKSALASPQNWTSMSKDEQAKIVKAVNEDLRDRIKRVKDCLSGLVDGVREASRVVVVGGSVLATLIGVYIWLHCWLNIPSYDKNNVAQVFNVIGNVKSSILKPEVRLEEVSEALKVLKDEKDVLISGFTERINYLKGFASNLATDRKEAVTQNDQRVVEIKKEIEGIEKKAERLTEDDGFFWVTRYWRWLEIVFWGEFGVIVGILAWVCTQVESGRYTKQMYEKEKYWYLTEIIIGPIVVVAVFFLLKQFAGTLLAGIAEEEVRGSIYVSLGISFALGLFIRRTLGIFDFIKDKLPLPKSHSSGGSQPAG